MATRGLLFILLMVLPAMTSSSGGPTRILFFGDSITELGVQPDGYITQLREMIEAAGKSDLFELIGAGVSGDKVYDLYLRLETDVLARKPDMVVIFVGVNDVWHKRLLGTGTDADKFTKFYEAIITKLEEKNIRIALTTPASIGEKPDCSNDLDGELNHYSQIIRNLAAKHSCTLVDLRKAVLSYEETENTGKVDKGILTVDGVHFNKKGNELAARLFASTLGIL
jgi:lysophospholipase L1-like esterase